MLDKVRKLHKLRQIQAECAESLRQSKQDWEDKNAYGMAVKSDVDAEIATLTAELKDERIGLYDGEDKGKRYGVGIRETTVLKYKKERAYQWALEHRLCLSLNVKPFEKIAKDGDIDFVTIETIPQATIAADLSQWVAKENDSDDLDELPDHHILDS